MGLWIRLRMEETPAFRRVQSTEHVEGVPVREAIRHHSREIVLVFAIASLSALGAYTLGAYFVTYLQEVVGLDPTTAILANFTAFFVTVPLVPFVGALGDRIGRKPLLFIGSVGFVVLSVPGYLLAGSGASLPPYWASFWWRCRGASSSRPWSSRRSRSSRRGCATAAPRWATTSPT